MAKERGNKNIEIDPHLDGGVQEPQVAVSDCPQIYEAIPGSDEWNELAPWPATYWKALPQGVRLRRRMRPLPQEEVCPRATKPAF